MTARLPLFVLTCDGPDLCELALRQPTEAERYAAKLEIMRMIRKQMRKNAAEKGARCTSTPE